MADDDIAVVAAAWYLLEKNENNENANIERGKRPYKRYDTVLSPMVPSQRCRTGYTAL